MALLAVTCGLGAVNIQATTYYSQGSVAPNTAANWNSARAGGGTSPTVFTTAGDIFIIQGTGNGGTTPHTMTTTAAWAVSGSGSKIEIENGATLKETSTFTVSLASGATMQVDNGGTFEHNINQGTIPTATWQTGSTLLISGQVAATSGPSGMGQSFFNVTWNCPSATATSQMGLGAAAGFSIAGTFTVANTGSGICRLNSTVGATLSIANISVTGGTLQGTGTSGANFTNNVSGNISVTGGLFDLRASSGTTTINLSGNFSCTSGTFSCSSSSGNAAVNFSGSSTQTFTSGGTFSPSGGIVTWTINSGATVDFGTSVLSGTPANVFTLSSGGGLITANTSASGAITTSGANGSIQTTGTRTYNTAANYTYNGSSAQVTGNGLTGANNLTINNSAGVTLTGNTPISGTLTLTAGILDSSVNSVVPTVTTAVSGGSSTAYVKGKLAQVYAGTGSKTFPIGKNGNYRALSLNYTALTGSSTVTAEQIDPGSGFGGSSANVTPYTSRYWTVTQSGGSAFTYNITLDGTGFSPVGIGVILKYNNPTTSKFSVTGTAPSYTASGLTSFSDFALGDDSGGGGGGTAPTIPSQPLNTANNYLTTATFSVTASGDAPLSYQWYKGSVSVGNVLVNSSHIGGALTNALGITNVTLADVGNYLVVITNASGSITSSVAALAVNDPYISAQPVNVTNAYQAATTTFSATGSGSGTVTYQWRTNGVSIANGGRFSGATSSTLSIATLTNSDANWSYTVAVSGTGLSVTSSAVTLTITNPVAYYQSVQSGNWNATSTWQESLDGTTWLTAIGTPTSSDRTITILNSVTNTSAISVDEVVVASGGTLAMPTVFTINNGTGDDIDVQSGGVFLLPTAATPPIFSSGSTAKIEGGGILRIASSGLTATGTGANATNFIYQSASILDYTSTSAFSASGVTYFTNADAATIPIFRISAAVGSPGGASPTLINGVLEVSSGFTVTWASAGTKTFRNGIRGAGSVAQGSAGQFIISGATADVGGAGTITLGSAGMQINSGSVVTLSSDKSVAGTGALTLAGTLDLNGKTLTAAIAPVFSGTNLTEIDRNAGSPLAGKIVLSSGTLAYGGALTVLNTGATLTGGEVFTLFSASAYSGSFSSITLPSLGAGLNWWTNLVVNGTLIVNRAPVAGATFTNYVVLGTPSVVQIIGGKFKPTDADNNTLTITGVTGQTNGTASTDGTNITYTATGAGIDSFTYTVADGFGGSASQSVSVVIDNSNGGQTGYNNLSATQSGGNAILGYAGIPGYKYALDITHDLTVPVTWTAVVTNMAATNGVIGSLIYTNPISGSPTNDFYRTRYVP